MMIQPNPMVRTLQGSPYQSFKEFFTQNGAQAQVFTINPSRRTTVVGENGTRLTFFPFSLVNGNGNLVDGEIEIRLREIVNKREMVLSDMVTTSEDRLLESAGQFQVQAFKNGRLLKLIKPFSVQLPLRGELSNPLGMKLFLGSTSTTIAFQGKRPFDWRQLSKKPVKIKKIVEKKYFSFDLEEFNWVNCDSFYAKKIPKTMVSAKFVCPVEDLNDQVAYLVFRDINSVARMYYGGHSFTTINIPVNLSARVLIMGLRQGRLYFGQTEIENTSTQMAHLHLFPLMEEELLQALRDL